MTIFSYFVQRKSLSPVSLPFSPDNPFAYFRLYTHTHTHISLLPLRLFFPDNLTFKEKLNCLLLGLPLERSFASQTLFWYLWRYLSRSSHTIYKAFRFSTQYIFIRVRTLSSLQAHRANRHETRILNRASSKCPLICTHSCWNQRGAANVQLLIR